MADDIDIEEHDVLESLRRRRAPASDTSAQASEAPSADTSLVKAEPLDPDYNDSHYEDPSNYEYNWEWEKDHPQIKVEPHTEDDFPFGRFILGSKPATPPPQDPPDQDPRQDRQETYNYNMSLVLEDWGPMLANSDCYCKECQTLFATVNALDAHKMIAHSFLVATDKEPSPERNKAVKSTAKPSDDQQTCQICQNYFKGIHGKSNLARHYREVHKVDPETIANKNFRSWRVCNHCNKYFPDDTSLVKHLYELLPLNNKTPAKDDKKTGPSSVKVTKPVNVDKGAKTVSKDIKATNSDIKPIQSNNVSTLNKNTNRIILGSKVQSKSSDDEKCWRCEICDIAYNRKYYMVHMRRYHRNVSVTKLKKTPIKQTLDIKSPEKVLLNNCNVRFKCIVCNEILTSYYMCRKHKLKHPQLYGKKCIVKLVKTSKTQDKVTELAKYKETKAASQNVTSEGTNILVSKSTIFKCNRCSVHFLTCTGACQHSIVCETSSNIRDWACPRCQRVFKSAEKAAHEYQHNVMSTNKFKVYVVYLEMIVRVLCECPDCFVCFEEDKFWRHVSGGCKSDADSYFCNECRLPIDVFSKANHDSKHNQGDFTRDDFIKIDYVSSKKKVPVKIKTEAEELESSVKNIKVDTLKKALKRKLEMVEVPPKKAKHYNPEELHLFFCPNCKTYLASKSRFHQSGVCKQATRAHHSLCTYCGLYFAPKYSKTHMRLHERYPNLTISDFTFTRITDHKKIRPQPVTYPCKSCNVNFHSKWAKHCHKCGETPSINCLVCQKRIQKVIFKTHMQIHNYVIPSKPKIIDRTNVPSSPIPSGSQEQSPKKKLPDLLMKYQSLTALWNILYLCATCDTFTDSYDKVVEHCQNHLLNMENYGVVIMKCQICDMKFDSECYRRHLELHAGSKVITKKTFQILKYDYSELFTNKWFDFINVPEEQKSQIVSRSIYGENRCVKMRLVQQGPPEYTLYKCSKCLNCVAPDTIVYHVKLYNCLKAHKLPCSICDMTFTIRTQCDEHEKIHKATGLGLESFRIVGFNDASDLDSNIKIMSYDTENHGSKNKISFTDEGVLPKVPALSKTVAKPARSKSFVFYKCAQCHVCQMHIYNFRKHECSNLKKKICSRCGLLFANCYMSLHSKLHERHNISRNNVVVKTVNKAGQVINIKKQIHEKIVTGSSPKKSNDTDEKSTLYKCYCGLHYTSLKTIEKHYKMKNCSTIVREKCSQCNLIFDPIEVVNHLCKHHAQNQTKSFNIITPNKKTLYKCSLCHILFYTKNIAINHQSKCDGKVSGKKCDKCGLAFDVTSLLTHLLDHQRNNKLRTDCYVIVKIPDEKVTKEKKIKGIRKSNKNAHVLFRCQKCDLHFLKRDSVKTHLQRHAEGIQTKKIENCKICGLRFTKKTLFYHEVWQHKKLNIKEFDVRDVGYLKMYKAKPDKERIPTTSKPKVKKQIEATSSPKAAPVVKVEPKPVEREVTVFKCVKCALHFTDESTLVNHYQDRCSKELTEECDDCAVKFASRNVQEHKKHHQNGVTLIMNIKATAKPNVEKVPRENTYLATRVKKKTEDPLEKYDNKLYKCNVCNFHYNSKKTISKHGPEFCKPKSQKAICEICDIGFTKHSLHRHTQIHQKYNFTKDDFVILTVDDLDDSKLTTSQADESQDDDVGSLDTSTELETPENLEPANSKVIVEEGKTHFLYKCADCNLYFVTQKACHKHILDHTPLDSKDYIECKLCGFQFTIMALQAHIKKHHAEQFNLEEVLVEEYQPNDIITSEKYYASEKDQSRLVSTSDDVKNISNSLEENDNEVTSCNEIVEKVESSNLNVANVDIDKMCDQDNRASEESELKPSDIKGPDNSTEC